MRKNIEHLESRHFSARRLLEQCGDGSQCTVLAVQIDGVPGLERNAFAFANRKSVHSQGFRFIQRADTEFSDTNQRSDEIWRVGDDIDTAAQRRNEKSLLALVDKIDRPLSDLCLTGNGVERSAVQAVSDEQLAGCGADALVSRFDRAGRR